MALLDDVKAALRISTSSTAFDGEVAELIAEARDELKRVGVDPELADADEPAPLVKRFIRTYAKAHFGLDNPDAERLEVARRLIQAELSLSSGYRAEQEA